MNRMKKHRIKEEKATTSSSSRRQEEHDLAYFIHDRVELMHQVFSVLKSKELKSLAPECVRRLSIDDLQELCLEELLGISSKRLCAILDGAEPPSDTDSSSQSAEQLETISLDSISSDDEILSQASKKKKNKHRHSKKKRRKKSKSGDEGESRASRAGLTVLELLELQARARAIRAQLHQEPTKTAEPAAEPASSDNDEVLIKEEPAEVVEISSDDEKPDVKRLDQQIGTATSQSNESETNKNGESKTVTKRINDLVITVPQSKPTRRIKLKRQKPTETVTKATTSNKVAEKEKVETSNTVNNTAATNVKKSETEPIKANNVEAKNRSKKSKKKKKKVKEKEGSDEDEITIQLSDTEKMDLLEDLDAKNFDNVSSSDSDSSETSEDSENENQHDEKQNITQKQAVEEQSKADNLENNKNTILLEITAEPQGKGDGKKDEEIRGYVSNDNEGTVEINDLPVISDDITTSTDNKEEESSNAKVDKQIDEKCDDDDQRAQDLSKEKTDDANKEQNNEKTDECAYIEKSDDIAESSSCIETKSDGEISDRESSEVEASDVQPEVVCISDDEQKKKKKKKKDKKSKKEKKKSGFREQTDENFYKDKDVADKEIPTVIETIDDDDDVYEYLEISDDSSCYEVEGVSVLSKEPTAEEIEAFSARMDEIDLEKDETVIPIPNENIETENDTNDLENVSWKDRYLGSKKVKRVLTTSNILNAIRKKNKQLKKKLEEAKKAELAEKEAHKDKEDDTPTVEDGTIEQYETLVGSTKYVDPVKEVDTTEAKDAECKEDSENKDNLNKEDENENVTKEMKKDAKQLLKMYKRLLKYNDITKQKDPNKKKKKKQKKHKDKEKVA
ncbi:LOW QUALITY PROTEIN: glutamic acid-rich protein-like [Cydia splendana]|uniref:LOW QUALITY PROTEIN: glutamic acid-rich protein-like n=1 Tax=Cydia splendana TaxID=1100963 RepID=UPI00300C1123